MLDERNDNSEVHMRVYKYNSVVKIVLSEGLQKIQLIQTKLSILVQSESRELMFSLFKIKYKKCIILVVNIDNGEAMHVWGQGIHGNFCIFSI